MKPLYRYGGCLSLALGLGLLLLPLGYFILTAVLGNLFVEVPGTVTTLQVRTEYDFDLNRNVTRYCPVVSYVTLDGASYTFDSNVCSTPSFYETGDTVTVIYPKDAPQNGSLRLDVLSWLGIGVAWTGGLLGGCFGIVAVGLFIAGAVAARRQPAPLN